MMKAKDRVHVIELPSALKELRNKIQEFIDVVSETPFVTIRMYTPERSIRRPYDSNDCSGDYTNWSDYNDEPINYYTYYHKYDSSIIYYDTIMIQLDNTWYSIKECDTDKNYLKIASESVRTITYGNTTTIIKTPIIQINVDKIDSDSAANMLIFAILKSLSDEKVFYLETTKGV